ncbi:MAG: glutamine amidotransferase [Erysipelotrichia bacterium]|nr:glutamine amidotransferase [Erysipelotrichia bacterium]NCC53949.1 glutamine amidotransferase [Erysipelotrichia bacterium]
MILKVLWMYHDIMDLYGDKGNMRVLQKRCEDRGIDIIIDTCAMKEEKNFNDYDILFIGGGADKEQSLLYEDLLARKADILEAMEKGTFILLICGGYQFFGKYYIDNHKQKIEGLNLFDYYTESNTQVGRCIGNIAIEANLDGEVYQVVGFENHGGQTMHVSTPFGKVLSGHGNTYQGEYEGFYNGQVLGTYMHGPLLPKNPEIADFIIRKGLKRKYGEVVLETLDDTLEKQAKAVMLKRMKVV